MNKESIQQYHELWNRVLKRIWLVVAIIVISFAILFSLFRALTPWATQYKSEVEKHLSNMLGQPVLISSMETSWYWFQPVLKLNQVSLSDDKSHQLKLNKLMVGINLFNSLLHWRIQPGILYADNIHLSIHQSDNGRWLVDGLHQQQQQMSVNQDDYLMLFHWLLGQQKIILKNVSALIHLKNGSVLPLSAFNMIAVNRDGHIKIKGMAQLSQPNATHLLTLADVRLSDAALTKLEGHAYVSIQDFSLEQWKPFFPKAAKQVESGKGDLELWLDFKEGSISNLQANVLAKKLSLKNPNGFKIKFIHSLKANLAWFPTQEGWQLSGDQIKLDMKDTIWPENSLLIDHNVLQQSYRLYIKNVLVESLLKSGMTLPQTLQPLVAVKPRGFLEDSQIGFESGEINYILTKFSGLAWQRQNNIPGISNLSGVFNWEPTAGRLEFDSVDTTIHPKKLKPVLLKQLNAGIEWKKLSHGFRISMDHLILSQIDFVLTARGLLDESSSRHLQLTAELSADNAVRWMSYIPANILKPKLNDWLKNDIKRIDKVSAHLKIDGNLEDFPFDNAPGEFSINSRLTGVDLFFNRDWPLSKDIDAFLSVNKRTLDSDIYYATMHKIPMQEVNLRIDELGLNQDTLLVHGKVKATGNEALGYIFHSPLKKHLGKLKALEVEGPVALDLQLQVPLYPGNDEVLAKGVVEFNDNFVTLHVLNKVLVPNFTGDLNFNEQGIQNSHFTASLFDNPIQLEMQSYKTPKTYTEIKAQGNMSVENIKNKFNIPLFALIDGELNLQSQFKLVDDIQDQDSINIVSDLQGVNVHLPAPFGKKANEKSTSTMKIDLVGQKSMHMQFDYDKKIMNDLWLIHENDHFALNKGIVMLGTPRAYTLPDNGLKLVGTFDKLDVKQWQSILEKLPKSNSRMLDTLSGIDFKINNLSLWSKKYLGVNVQASKENNDIWDLSIEQQDLTAQLKYQISKNILSGKLGKLYLSKSYFSNTQDKTTLSHLKPLDIPNLNITIDNFRMGQLDIGTVEINSTSTKNKWLLNSGKITSPTYELNAKGVWNQIDNKNVTELEGNVQIQKLSDSLKRWNITPAVEARSGNISFEGHWPGTINEFSLKKTNAQLYMELKDGRITHLSPEMESKLGLGKLLSILSLQTIPRRLKLDFSDLANNGYTYDVFKGNFSLQNGVMKTQNSYIDGPVAYASMKGDLDVVKHLYNMDLQVSPHITASLPVVATIAGGPIAGIATWAASKILSQSMQIVTGYSYKVSGPWEEPVVQQVSIFKK